jgi:hypothetical protein
MVVETHDDIFFCLRIRKPPMMKERANLPRLSVSDIRAGVADRQTYLLQIAR